MISSTSAAVPGIYFIPSVSRISRIQERLTEKAADIGTGKIWTELKKKIGDRPDSFECRLYGAIEKSVGEYLCHSGFLCKYLRHCVWYALQAGSNAVSSGTVRVPAGCLFPDGPSVSSG